MKVINIQIRIKDLSQTGVDWDDEDEVHMYLNYLRKDLRSLCEKNIPVDKESVVINAVVANLVEQVLPSNTEVMSHSAVRLKYKKQTNREIYRKTINNTLVYDEEYVHWLETNFK